MKFKLNHPKETRNCLLQHLKHIEIKRKHNDDECSNSLVITHGKDNHHIYSIPHCLEKVKLNTTDRSILMNIYAEYWIERLNDVEVLCNLFNLLKYDTLICRCKVNEYPSKYNHVNINNFDERVKRCYCHGQVLKLLLSFILSNDERFKDVYNKLCNEPKARTIVSCIKSIDNLY